MTPAVLVLAGLDPSGGAGILADAEAVRAASARPLCVATALTVQTTRAARRWEPVAPALVLEQARALLEEEPIRAIKIGMLGTPQMARGVRDLVSHARLPVVVDPVLRASSGAALYGGEPADLIFAGAILTPNLAEAQALLGMKQPPADAAAMRAAAEQLVARGALAVLLKGGHLKDDAVDILFSAGHSVELAGTRLPGEKRGTGCRLASALAARLALNDPIEDAAKFAKALVRRYIAS